MPREGTGGNRLDFLSCKILIELSLDESRPAGESLSFMFGHTLKTSEHPIVFESFKCFLYAQTAPSLNSKNSQRTSITHHLSLFLIFNCLGDVNRPEKNI